MRVPETSYRTRQLVVFTASVLLLAGLIYSANISRIVSAITSIEPVYLVAALILANIPVLLYSYSWFIVFRSKNFDTTYLETFKLKLASLFISNSTPFGDAGGEPFIAYRISKDREKEYIDTLSTIAFTDFLTLLPFYLLAIVAFMTFMLTNTVGLYLSTIISILTVGLLTTTVYWNRLWLLNSADSLMVNTRSYINTEPIKKIIEKIRKAVENYRLERKDVVKILSIGILAFLFDLSSFIALSAGLNFELNVLTLVFVITVSRAANLAPSIGGAGVYELTLTGLLVSLSTLTVAEALSLAILYRGITFYFGTLIGFIALNKN